MSHIITTKEQRKLLIGPSGILDAENHTQTEHTIEPHEIAICHKWLTRATVARPPEFSSFWVKHVVENWAGEKISHGALIVAAHEAGFEISKPEHESGSNVSLGLDATDLREFDCGCGHP